MDGETVTAVLLLLIPLISVGELVMSDEKERRSRTPGRRQKDGELWALAKDAFDKATQASMDISQHVIRCEEQNKTIIKKLEVQDEWRSADLAFQRKLIIGALSALGLLLAQIVGKATGLL